MFCRSQSFLDVIEILSLNFTKNLVFKTNKERALLRIKEKRLNIGNTQLFYVEKNTCY